MGDDRRKKPFMSDDDRATAHRRSRATPAMGSPRAQTARDEEDEHTPPPQTPPRPDQLPGFETISPPIQDQLNMLADGLGSLTSAVGRVWNSKDADDRLSRLDQRFDTLNQNDADHRAQIEEFLKPAVKALMGRLDMLLGHHESNKARVETFWTHEWPAVKKSIDVLDGRLDRIEKAQERHEIETKNAISRISDTLTATAARVERVENRLTIVEVKLRDREVEEKTIVATSLRRKATLGAIGAALGAGISQLIHWLRG